MKPIISLGCILAGAWLIGMPSYAQVKSNHSFTQPTPIPMEAIQSQDKNKAAVRRLFEEILNTGKLDQLSQIISEEYTGANGEKGPVGFAKTVTLVITSFPDVQWTVEDLMAEGNKVMVKWSWKGINTVSFNGFPVTNQPVTHHAIVIYQFSGSKIVKASMESDRLGFFQQIGVLSPEATAPPTQK